MRRIWYDWEFIDNGTTIEPISIGMVDDTGGQLLLFNGDLWPAAIAAHPWLKENVLPHLPIYEARGEWFWDLGDSRVQTHAGMADLVRRWITKGGEAELWGYYPSYDHVTLAQLWGPMKDLPNGVPMVTFDVQQEWVRLGRPDGVKPPEPKNAHDALVDADWTRLFWETCRSYAWAAGDQHVWGGPPYGAKL